MQSSTTN